MFYGRDSERATIDRMLQNARLGGSTALVIRGEAGIGKTALLDYAVTAASDEMGVLRGIGVESEAELPFAGLHLLLHGELDRIRLLPARQLEAMQAALGHTTSAGEDRYLVGLAVLTLLADLAEDRPLLV